MFTSEGHRASAQHHRLKRYNRMTASQIHIHYVASGCLGIQIGKILNNKITESVYMYLTFWLKNTNVTLTKIWIIS